MKLSWLLSCLGLLISASATAEWVRLNESGTDTHFVDPATVRVQGTHVRMWKKIERATPDEDGTLSTRSYFEYDCHQRRFRLLTVSAYDGSDLGGKTVASSNTPSEWFFVPPDTSAEAALEFACKRQKK
jgi:hypothetical protein